MSGKTRGETLRVFYFLMEKACLSDQVGFLLLLVGEHQKMLDSPLLNQLQDGFGDLVGPVDAPASNSLHGKELLNS